MRKAEKSAAKENLDWISPIGYTLFYKNEI